MRISEKADENKMLAFISCKLEIRASLHVKEVKGFTGRDVSW